MNTAPIYVVLSPTGGEGYSVNSDGALAHPGGPIVMETDIGTGSTLEKARERVALLERRFGACRVGRVVFEDHPAFNEVRGLCGEGDCHYFGQQRPSTCACSKVTP